MAVTVPEALEALAARWAAAAAIDARGYGPLVRDPAGLLDLPAGFRYRAFSMGVVGRTDDPRFSSRLDNGDPVPARHDGMAAFPGPGGVTVLVRNHEMNPGATPAVDPARARAYDPAGNGGTTTLWVDRDRNLVRSFASLSGTFRNCAGGATPWGSWLSCEECTYMPGGGDPVHHDRRPDVQRRHGYVFEVDARATELAEPTPIRAMGRFYHEALAVDPATGIVYLSEDRTDGLFYRYRPDVVFREGRRPADLRVGDLAKGGVLEALRIVDRPGADTSHHALFDRSFPRGRKFRVDWVPIPDVDPEMDMERDPHDTGSPPLERRARTAASSTRAQGARAGAARFSRGEGVCHHGGSIYFCCTDGGRTHDGQVWRLEPAARRLSLLVEPNDRRVLDGPDNLMMSPFGDLIVCEDGESVDRVLGITPKGRIYPLARNAFNDAEFAGACFSPDGETMFVNMQEPGVTFAIWGPWRSRRA